MKNIFIIQVMRHGDYNSVLIHLCYSAEVVNAYDNSAPKQKIIKGYNVSLDP